MTDIDRAVANLIAVIRGDMFVHIDEYLQPRRRPGRPKGSRNKKTKGKRK